MSKDLFEQRIGEALREAESTPPAGAWDFIQSRIQAPYTPPFNFPTWAVVAVSTVLLGAMTLSNIKPEKEGVPVEKRAYVSDSEMIQSTSVEPSANTVTAEVVFADEPETAEHTVEAVKNSEDKEETSEIVVSSEADVEEAQTIKSTTTNVSTAAESKLPVMVQAVEPWTEELVEKPIAIDREEESSDVQDSSSEFEPELAIEGLKTCYTPCELILNARGNAAEYAWDAASFGLIQGEKLNITIDEPQTLTVYAIAKYDNGSERVIPQVVEVKKGSKLFVPNSFTPNGDGVNDEFSVSGNGIVSFSMTIINSKGKVVFKTTDINEAWNFSGSNYQLENEVYTAIVRAVGNDGRSHTANQRLTILP